MQTDKELFHIFGACPEAIFQWAHLPVPKDCKLSSICVKGLQLTMDGFIAPEDPAEPLTIAEFQFQRVPAIYPRIAAEMAMIQMQHDMRMVQGIICFGEASLDPATEPWKSSGLIRIVYIKEELQEMERQTPDHPLVAVFKPIFEPSQDSLEKEAARHYRQLKQSALSPERRKALCEAFESLLTQRLSHRTAQQIAMILELPDIRDTVCGKELIAEGRMEGMAEGLAEGKAEGELEKLRNHLCLFGAKKFGPLSSDVTASIQKLNLAQGDELFDRLFEMNDVGDLERWLSERGS